MQKFLETLTGTASQAADIYARVRQAGQPRVEQQPVIIQQTTPTNGGAQAAQVTKLLFGLLILGGVAVVIALLVRRL